MAKNTGKTDFSKTALLLVAHGSPHSPGGPSTTRRLAQIVEKTNQFKEVGMGFITEKPFARDALDALNASEIYIVPNLATQGYVCQEKLPRSLGLTGAVTERLSGKGHQRLILTEPVGTHPLMSKILTDLVLSVMAESKFKAKDTALFIIGHGSTKSRASFSQVQNIVEDLKQFFLVELGCQNAILATFLEEAPYIKNWKGLCDAKNIIFAPFLIADGFHASRDIPLAIGLDCGNPEFQECLAQNSTIKTTLNDRNIVYLPPLGTAPEVAQVILARVQNTP